MRAFRVQTAQHTYRCLVERGAIAQLNAAIPGSASSVFVVTTPRVWTLHGNRLAQGLDYRDFTVLVFDEGEQNKRLANVETLAEQMVHAGADRRAIIVGFGGGVVTDIAGFLAAIYMRGIDIVQIPTTLLAQVDAGIGGKTGVNLASGKNLLGSFHHPVAVLIDPDVLQTLPAREYRAGLFEIIKCGVIRDAHLFDALADRSQDVLSMEPALLDELIGAAVKIKCEVVSMDDRESDLRRILNFGHTVGHAIEAETGYERFLHGEAVGWGMLVATRLAELLGILEPDIARRIGTVICRYGPLPPVRDLDVDRLMARLANDKKTVSGRLHFVLPEAIGRVKIVSGIDPAAIRQSIADVFTLRA